MDGTMRDWQRHTAQFTPGKNFDRSGSLGPHVVLAAEFGDYKAKTLVTRLNGQEVQRTPVELMLFDAETLIAYISSLKPGDRIEVEVSGIGILANPIEAEPSVA